MNTLITFPCFGCVFPSRKSDTNPSKMILSTIIITLIALFFILPSVQCKQTILVESLESKNDKIVMKLLKETHNYIEYDRYMSSIKFKCKAILKNDLTKNTRENISNIKLHLDYGQVMSLKNNEALMEYEPSQLEEVKKIDKILDILNGQCLYYTTSTFIYEYCHKEHVRQFDSAFTKAMNVKSQFEDISMGVYNLQEHTVKKVKKGFVELTDEERKVKLPEHSDFSEDYNFLYIDGIDRKYGKLEVQESEDGNLLFTNAHLVATDGYFVSSPMVIKFICEEIQYDQHIKQVINYALLVDPYTFVYTNKQGKCDRYESHQYVNHEVQYLQDNNQQPIRVYGKYLYGNAEEICTKNWAWQRNQNSQQFDVHLHEGSLLFLELYNVRQKQIQYHYGVVKQVISASLIQLETPLGQSVKVPINAQEMFNRSTIKSYRLVANITKCELMFNKDLRLGKSMQLSYIGNGIIKIHNKTEIKKGDNIGCICKSAIRDSFKIVDVDITITDHLLSDYYHGFINSNTNIYSTPGYNGKQYLLKECHDYACFFLAEQQNKNNSTFQKKMFTEILKLSNRNPTYEFNQSKINHFYVLTIKGNGIIKLVTRSKNGQIFTYLITQGQIIKMIEFKNGTKEIIKQNTYYENSTEPSKNIHDNYIYIKINRLPNGSYYGGIWKVRDIVYFPRFLLFDEELVSLDRISGYAYLRILKLQNLRDREHMAVIKYMKKLQKHYSMKQKLQRNPQATLFLDKSYSINYQYVSGKYCPSVNKFRKTTVQLKCGRTWFSITKLFQTSPCEYWIEIETTLLCRQGYKEVVQSDEHILNRNNGVISSNGILCHPSEGLLNEVPPYLYLQQSIQ